MFRFMRSVCRFDWPLGIECDGFVYFLDSHIENTMVEQSDRAPLLDWEEVPPSELVPAAPSPETEDSVQSGLSSYPTEGGVQADISLNARPKSVTAVSGESAHSPQKQHSGQGGDASATDEEGDCAFHGLSVRDRRITGWEEKDQIVAVFVVTFDTRSGEVNCEIL